MTGLEDIYSLRKPGLPSIPEMTQMPNMIMNNGSPDLLQAQLAMLHPVQKFQFLQQQIQNHQMATHILNSGRRDYNRTQGRRGH